MPVFLFYVYFIYLLPSSIFTSRFLFIISVLYIIYLVFLFSFYYYIVYYILIFFVDFFVFMSNVFSVSFFTLSSCRNSRLFRNFLRIFLTNNKKIELWIIYYLFLVVIWDYAHNFLAGNLFWIVSCTTLKTLASEKSLLIISTISGDWVIWN